MVNSASTHRISRLLKGGIGALTVLGAAVGATAVPASAADDRQVYVALGDSMASGPLIPDFTGPLACGRSTHNYAHELAQRLGVDQLKDVTCSGAKSKHMTQPQSLSLLGVPAGQAAPQLDAVTSDATLVSLTIGGNDAGLVGIAEDCLQLDPTASPCKDDFIENGVDTVAQRIDSFGPALGAVLDGIHQRAPQARIVVTGYGEYIKPGGCWPEVPLLAADADWLQESVNHLNRVIGDQASAHGATYVDLVPASKGHDVCQAPEDKWVEGYVPTDLAAPLHPNRRGEENYARIIHERLSTGA